MFGLPASLSIALWLVGCVWIVALVGYYFEMPSEFVWMLLLVGIGAALFEWSARRKSE
jgi:hypothetical protein